MTTITTALANQSSTKRRRLSAALIALALTVVTLVVSVQPAEAARPGVFNYAQCIPGSRTITQDIEAYRSYANEYVMLQGALVNRATGGTSYSQWAVGTGSTAHTAVRWSSVARGTYNVFYRWSVWNASRRQYVTSGWVQLTGAALNTYGVETYPGSRVYIGGGSGYCTI